jgi:hypothetical protein
MGFTVTIPTTGMANPSPNVATRFRPGQSGNRRGPQQTRFIREILRERDPDGQPMREQIVRHLIEVATRWNVIVLGRDMEVASARDSVEAAKLLLSYDVGKPRDMPDPLVVVPPDVETEGRPLLDIIVDVYRSLLVNGELTEGGLNKLTGMILSVDQAKIALALKLMGKNVAGKDPQEIQALLNGTALPSRAPTDPICAAQVERNEVAEADPASPNDRDMSDHAPAESESLEPPGSAAPFDDEPEPTSPAVTTRFVAADDDDGEDD